MTREYIMAHARDRQISYWHAKADLEEIARDYSPAFALWYARKVAAGAQFKTSLTGLFRMYEVRHMDQAVAPLDGFGL